MCNLHFTVVQVDYEKIGTYWHLALNGTPVQAINFGGTETARQRAQDAADELNTAAGQPKQLTGHESDLSDMPLFAAS